MTRTRAPLLARKQFGAPSMFTPDGLLREARRQKRLRPKSVPKVCVLDPDGDIVRYLVAAGRARLDPSWPCYHTRLYVFRHTGQRLGIIGCAVGGAFAVLVAEELFASGCQFLVSVTSAGEILPVRKPPYFVLIERALRDEGTSYHYRPASAFSHSDGRLVRLVHAALEARGLPVVRGTTWTTDAPFRETAPVIRAYRAEGILAVEMEAAALYAFARARHRAVVCFAHVTNRMGQVEGDFVKGTNEGAPDALAAIEAAAQAWRSARGHL